MLPVSSIIPFDKYIAGKGDEIIKLENLFWKKTTISRFTFEVNQFIYS